MFEESINKQALNVLNFLEADTVFTVSITLDGTLSIYLEGCLFKSFSSAKDKIDAAICYDDKTVFTSETESFSLCNMTGSLSPVYGMTATQKMDVLAQGGDCVYAGSVNGFINKI